MELIPEGPQVEDLEIRAFTSHRPSGDVPGYQLRFLFPDRAPGDWVFLTEADMEELPGMLIRHMHSDGHLRTDIGGSVH